MDEAVDVFSQISLKYLEIYVVRGNCESQLFNITKMSRSGGIYQIVAATSPLLEGSKLLREAFLKGHSLLIKIVMKLPNGRRIGIRPFPVRVILADRWKWKTGNPLQLTCKFIPEWEEKWGNVIGIMLRVQRICLLLYDLWEKVQGFFSVPKCVIIARICTTSHYAQRRIGSEYAVQIENPG